MNMQSHWKYYLGDGHIVNVGWDRAAYVNPVRTVLDHGIIVSESSDADVLGVNPWLSMWCAVNRLTAAGVELGAEEKISVEEAIWISTMAGAYQTHEENVKGSIEAGKFADFVVIGEDILTVDPLAIKDIPVLMTIVGGKIEYNADPGYLHFN